MLLVLLLFPPSNAAAGGGSDCETTGAGVKFELTVGCRARGGGRRAATEGLAELRLRGDIWGPKNGDRNGVLPAGDSVLWIKRQRGP